MGVIVARFGDLCRAGLALNLPVDVMNAIKYCPSATFPGTFGGLGKSGIVFGFGAFDTVPFEQLIRRLSPHGADSFHDRMVAQLVALKLT